MADVQEQLDFLLSVDRLISAAEEAKRKRDKLLGQGRIATANKPTGDKQNPKSQKDIR